MESYYFNQVKHFVTLYYDDLSNRIKYLSNYEWFLLLDNFIDSFVFCGHISDEEKLKIIDEIINCAFDQNEDLE